MSIDIRIISTVIYFVIIFLSLKSAADNGGGYIPDVQPLITLPLVTLLYAIFWIIWLNLN